MLKHWPARRTQSQKNVDSDFHNTGAILRWKNTAKMLRCVTELYLGCCVSWSLFWAHLLMQFLWCTRVTESKRNLWYIMEEPLQPVNTTIKKDTYKIINTLKDKFWNYYWEGQDNTNLQRIKESDKTSYRPRSTCMCELAIKLCSKQQWHTVNAIRYRKFYL